MQRQRARRRLTTRRARRPRRWSWRRARERPISSRNGSSPTSRRAHAGAVKKAARTVGGIADFDAQYAGAQDDQHRRWPWRRCSAPKSTPTFFINGRKLEQVLPPSLFELAIEHELQKARVRRRTCPPTRHRDMPAAISIENLTKDYQVGFWRKRPYRALDRLIAGGPARRGLRLSRAERRRQDDHAEAADAADLPDVGARRDSWAARRRRRRRGSGSATFRKIRTSTTT